GEEIKDVHKQFKHPRIAPISMPLPKWLANYLGNKIFKATVKFNSKKCKLCSTCWDNCPGNAILPPSDLRKGNVPKWNKRKCFTCYCCVELCPHEAVDFKINYVKNAILSWPCAILVLILVSILYIFIGIF
ncbi:MAG: ATP-binding protein, partial [Promethearchaeota archaeon]